MKKVSELLFRKVANSTIEIYDGERMLGYVSPVIDGINRPTGTWCYTIPQYRMGKVFNSEGYKEQMLDYINWHAGHNWKQAAIKLAHKLGYKD